MAGRYQRTSNGVRETLYSRDPVNVFSNLIVRYSIDSGMKSRLAVTALTNAVARRGEVVGCIVHTDRGSQLRSRRIVRALNRPGTGWPGPWVGSVPPVTMRRWRASSASCNATCWTGSGGTPANKLRIAIMTWIERTYHRRRRQNRLGRLTPIEYETIMTPTVTQAA